MYHTEGQEDRWPPSSDGRPQNAARLDHYGDLLTMRQVSELTGLGMSHLYEAARSGWIAPLVVRFGPRLMRVPKAALLRHLNESDGAS